MKRLVYVDHAATTPLSNAAFEAMVPFMREEFGNPSSVHGWAKGPRKAIQKARETMAECICADPEEIYFTSGGTEADNWVIKGSSGGLMVSSYEHHAVLNAAASEAAKGRLVCYCEPKILGNVVANAITQAWQEGIKLVSVMAANNEIGTCNDVGDLAKRAHSLGALFHTDAVQAVGHVPIDVKWLDCDFLSASAHKFNGPRGVGFLYVRKGLSLNPLMDGGQQEQRMRAGTENVAGIVGMAAALKENCDHLRENAAHLDRLAEKLTEGILRIKRRAYIVGSEVKSRLPGFVAVSFQDRSAEGIVHVLDLKGVAISAGAACDSKNTQISHVLNALTIPPSLAKGTVRISLGVENTEADVETILGALKVALQ